MLWFHILKRFHRFLNSTKIWGRESKNYWELNSGSLICILIIKRGKSFWFSLYTYSPPFLLVWHCIFFPFLVILFFFLDVNWGRKVIVMIFQCCYGPHILWWISSTLGCLFAVVHWFTMVGLGAVFRYWAHIRRFWRSFVASLILFSRVVFLPVSPYFREVSKSLVLAPSLLIFFPPLSLQFLVTTLSLLHIARRISTNTWAGVWCPDFVVDRKAHVGIRMSPNILTWFFCEAPYDLKSTAASAFVSVPRILREPISVTL